MPSDIDVVARVEQLKLMHAFMLMSNNVRLYVNRWTRFIPDGATDRDFRRIAANIDHYNQCCDVFAELVQDKTMRW